MKRFSFLMLFLTNGLCLAGSEADGPAHHALLKGHYKESIALYKKLIEKGPDNDKGKWLKDLSIAYYKDQEHAKAFKTFLESLESAPIVEKEEELTPAEAHIYKDALEIYLDPKERDPQEMSFKIRDVYAGTLRLHPSYYHLGYLVSIAYANLGAFETFFDFFYSSYLHLPDHYLAFKTKAILHIKLLERAKTVEEKEQERVLILKNLAEAKKRYPKDPSLYKLEIIFSPDSDRYAMYERNLKEIINNNIMIPRSDLSFYFDQAFAHRQLALAKSFLEKARSWYPYSRTLDKAQEMIDQQSKE